MNYRELFDKINIYMDELDFISAKEYMIANKEILTENLHRLDRNAQELLEFVINENIKPLIPTEISIIHAINRYATNFDIHALKLIIKERSALISRKDTIQYLNSDAKMLLHSMRIINVNE